MGEMDSENGLGHVDELDEGNELEVVQFADEEGKVTTAAILAIVEVENSDYAVLAPVEQLNDDESDELELFLFGYGEDEEGNEVFSWIEDEETFNKVQLAASTLLESEEAVGEA